MTEKIENISDASPEALTPDKAIERLGVMRKFAAQQQEKLKGAGWRTKALANQGNQAAREQLKEFDRARRLFALDIKVFDFAIATIQAAHGEREKKYSLADCVRAAGRTPVVDDVLAEIVETARAMNEVR